MTVIRYRTLDGVADYRFELLQHDGSWQAHILGQPSYGSRNALPGATGRTRDTAGRHLVSTSMGSTTPDAARAAARDWAEANQQYLRTGRFGPAGVVRPPCPARGPGEVEYHALDGTGIYVFRFVRHGSKWRAMIVRQPPYAGRGESAHSSHRLGLGSGTPYVCWAPEPQSRAAIEEVARVWAEGTQRYIASGRFPSPAEIPAPRSPRRPHAPGAVRPPAPPPPPRRRTRVERLREWLG